MKQNGQLWKSLSKLVLAVFIMIGQFGYHANQTVVNAEESGNYDRVWNNQPDLEDSGTQSLENRFTYLSVSDKKQYKELNSAIPESSYPKFDFSQGKIFFGDMELWRDNYTPDRLLNAADINQVGNPIRVGSDYMYKFKATYNKGPITDNPSWDTRAYNRDSKYGFYLPKGAWLQNESTIKFTVTLPNGKSASRNYTVGDWTNGASMTELKRNLRDGSSTNDYFWDAAGQFGEYMRIRNFYLYQSDEKLKWLQEWDIQFDKIKYQSSLNGDGIVDNWMENYPRDYGSYPNWLNNSYRYYVIDTDTEDWSLEGLKSTMTVEFNVMIPGSMYNDVLNNNKNNTFAVGAYYKSYDRAEHWIRTKPLYLNAPTISKDRLRQVFTMDIYRGLNYKKEDTTDYSNGDKTPATQYQVGSAWNNPEFPLDPAAYDLKLYYVDRATGEEHSIIVPFTDILSKSGAFNSGDSGWKSEITRSVLSDPSTSPYKVFGQLVGGYNLAWHDNFGSNIGNMVKSGAGDIPSMVNPVFTKYRVVKHGTDIDLDQTATFKNSSNVEFRVIFAPITHFRAGSTMDWYNNYDYTYKSDRINLDTYSGTMYIVDASVDSDHDGLTDADELAVTKTDPFNADTDGDGKKDYTGYTDSTYTAKVGDLGESPDNLKNYDILTRNWTGEGYESRVDNGHAVILKPSNGYPYIYGTDAGVKKLDPRVIPANKGDVVKGKTAPYRVVRISDWNNGEKIIGETISDKDGNFTIIYGKMPKRVDGASNIPRNGTSANGKNIYVYNLDPKTGDLTFDLVDIPNWVAPREKTNPDPEKDSVWIDSIIQSVGIGNEPIYTFQEKQRWFVGTYAETVTPSDNNKVPTLVYAKTPVADLNKLTAAEKAVIQSKVYLALHDTFGYTWYPVETEDGQTIEEGQISKIEVNDTGVTTVTFRDGSNIIVGKELTTFQGPVAQDRYYPYEFITTLDSKPDYFRSTVDKRDNTTHKIIGGPKKLWLENPDYEDSTFGSKSITDFVFTIENMGASDGDPSDYSKYPGFEASKIKVGRYDVNLAASWKLSESGKPNEFYGKNLLSKFDENGESVPLTGEEEDTSFNRGLYILPDKLTAPDPSYVKDPANLSKDEEIKIREAIIEKNAELDRLLDKDLLNKVVKNAEGQDEIVYFDDNENGIYDYLDRIVLSDGNATATITWNDSIPRSVDTNLKQIGYTEKVIFSKGDSTSAAIDYVKNANAKFGEYGQMPDGDYSFKEGSGIDTSSIGTDKTATILFKEADSEIVQEITLKYDVNSNIAGEVDPSVPSSRTFIEKDTPTRAVNETEKALIEKAVLSANTTLTSTTHNPVTPTMVTSTDAASNNPIGNAFDGNDSTIWHTTWDANYKPVTDGHVAVVAELAEPKYLNQITYLPRQDSEPNGTITKLKLYTSLDGSNWTAVSENITWNNDKSKKTYEFTPVKTKYVKFVPVLSNIINGKTFASAAEFGIMESGIKSLVVDNEGNAKFTYIDDTSDTIPYTKLVAQKALGGGTITTKQGVAVTDSAEIAKGVLNATQASGTYNAMPAGTTFTIVDTISDDAWNTPQTKSIKIKATSSQYESTFEQIVDATLVIVELNSNTYQPQVNEKTRVKNPGQLSPEELKAIGEKIKAASSSQAVAAMKQTEGIPTVTQVGDKIRVTYNDDSYDELNVSDVVLQDAEVGGITVTKGDALTAVPEGAILNATSPTTNYAKLPTNTTLEFVNLTGNETASPTNPDTPRMVDVKVSIPNENPYIVKVPLTVKPLLEDQLEPEVQKITVRKDHELNSTDAANTVRNKDALKAGNKNAQGTAVDPTYDWTGTKPDTTTVGTNKAGKVKVTYADDSSDIKDVTVDVVSYADYTKVDPSYAPQAGTITVPQGTKLDPNNGADKAKEAIANSSNVEYFPQGTTFKWKTTVDTTSGGPKTGTVIVTYPDHSTVEVPNVTVNVLNDGDSYNYTGKTIQVPWIESTNPAFENYIADRAKDAVDTNAPSTKNIVYTFENPNGPTVNNGQSETRRVTITFTDGSPAKTVTATIEWISSDRLYTKTLYIYPDTELNDDHARNAVTNTAGFDDDTKFIWTSVPEKTDDKYPVGELTGAKVGIEGNSNIEPANVAIVVVPEKPLGKTYYIKSTVGVEEFKAQIENVSDTISNLTSQESAIYSWKDPNLSDVEFGVPDTYTTKVTVDYTDALYPTAEATVTIVVDDAKASTAPVAGSITLDPGKGLSDYSPAEQNEKAKQAIKNAADLVANENAESFEFVTSGREDGDTSFKYPDEILKNHPGTYPAKVRITYKDGTTRDVIVTVVVPKYSESYFPEGKTYETQPYVDKINVTTFERFKGNLIDVNQEQLQGKYKSIGFNGPEVDLSKGNKTTEVTLVVTWNDDTKSNVKAWVKVGSMSDLLNPVGQGFSVEKGDKITKGSDLAKKLAEENITNKDDLSLGEPTYDFANDVERNVAGANVPVEILVTYNDGTSETVSVIMHVNSQAEFNTPSVKDDGIVVDRDYDITQVDESGSNPKAAEAITNKDDLPMGTKFTFVQPSKLDTSEPGDYENVEILVSYPDGSSEVVKVNVHVNDNSETYEPETTTLNGQRNVPLSDYDDPTVGNTKAAEAVTNKDELPAGTKYDFDETSRELDTSKPGDHDVTVIVTYPDKTTDTFTTKIHIPYDNEIYPVNTQDISAEKGKPLTDYADEKVGNTKAAEAVTNKEDLPKGTKYDFKDPSQVDTSKPGDYTATVVISYPDGSKVEKTVKVHIPSDAETFTPIAKEIEVPMSKDATKPGTPESQKISEEAIENFADLPDGTVADLKDVLPTNVPGTYPNVVIVVKYPDGSHEEVKTTIVVKSDAQRNTPKAQDVTVEKGGVVTPGSDESQKIAEEAITNLDELPEGTTVDLKDPVDTTTPGEKPVTIVVTYPDGSQDEIEVHVNVLPDDSDKYTPQTQDVTVDQGGVITPDSDEGKKIAEEAITNLDELPEGTTVDLKDPIDTSVPGITNVTIVVTYPDGSQEEVTVSVHVKPTVKPQGNGGTKPNQNDDSATDTNQPAETSTDKDKYQPEVQPIKQPVGDKVVAGSDKAKEIAKSAIKNVQQLPAGTKFDLASDLDLSKPGTYTVKIVVTYPDGSSETVQTTVTVEEAKATTSNAKPTDTAKPANNDQQWGLVTLLATIVATVFGLVGLTLKKDKDGVIRNRATIGKIGSAVSAIAAIIVLAVFEKFTGTMVLFDQYSIWTIVLMLISAVFFFVGNKKSNEK